VHAFVSNVQAIAAPNWTNTISPDSSLVTHQRTNNIRYLDLNSGITKTCHHATFDEAWYLQDDRPPAAQLLYTLGLKSDSTFTTSLPDGPIDVAHYPPQPALDITLPDTAPARMSHLLLRLSPAPAFPSAAVNTTHCSPHSGTCIAIPHNATAVSLSYGITAADVAQVYLSPTPYNDAFGEELDLQKFDFSRHRAAGMAFLPKDNRLILANMVASTPGARVP
jgi:hypothetical protein